MVAGVAGQRRGRFGRAVVRCFALCLLLGVAAGGVLFGPALATDLSRGAKTYETTRRKLEALRKFALFRAPGDRAILRWGQPAVKTRSKKPTTN
jgi:hypothetical protein